MDERGDLADKRLLIVGDDDLFSVVAALSGEPALIVVCEQTLSDIPHGICCTYTHVYVTFSFVFSNIVSASHFIGHFSLVFLSCSV